MARSRSSERPVLVTGGAGFIGRHVVSELLSDRPVRVLDRFRTSDFDEMPAEVRSTEGDVRNHDLLARASDGVDTIVHLARPTEEAKGTQSVLEQAVENDAHVVLASSAAVYGEPVTVPTPESAILAPISTYGKRKRRAERLVERFRERHGLSATVLRYFNVYGPRANGGYGGLPGRFLEQALDEGAVQIAGDGSQTRDFVHVRDAARATAAAVEKRPNLAINVGSGESLSVASIARWIATITGADVRYVSRPDSDPDRSEAAIDRMQRVLGVDLCFSIVSDVRHPFQSGRTERCVRLSS